VYRPASFLCRGARARGQRERGSVSNTPPAALVRSVLNRGALTPSAEKRGLVGGGRGLGSVSNTSMASSVRSVLCSGAPTPSAEVRRLGVGGGSALCQIRPRLLSSGQYFVAARLLPLKR
jgi:hypothetical protein